VLECGNFSSRLEHETSVAALLCIAEKTGALVLDVSSAHLLVPSASRYSVTGATLVVASLTSIRA